MAKLSDKKKTTSFVSAPQSVDKAGFMTETAEDSVPEGWLECSGQVVLQADYPDLFAAIGTTYNTGGEAGNEFRLPPNESIGKEDGVAIAAGNIGEKITAPSTTTAIGAGAWANVNSITLTPGVWMIYANGRMNDIAGPAWGSLITNPIPGGGSFEDGTYVGVSAGNHDDGSLHINLYANISVSTTYYFHAFSNSNPTSERWGMYAVRIA